MTISTHHRFQLVRRIGRTSVSQSYEAVHPLRPGRFLLEVLPGLRDHADARAAFERDAGAAASLGHPHLLQTLEMTSLPDGTPIAVSELPEGKTLNTWLSEDHAALPDAASKLITALGDALHAAHRIGVSHGHVSAENVFLVKVSGGSGDTIGLPKLGGFGWRWVPTAHTKTGASITQDADARTADIAGLAHLAEQLLAGGIAPDDPVITSFFVGPATREVLQRAQDPNAREPFDNPAAFASALATALACNEPMEPDVEQLVRRAPLGYSLRPRMARAAFALLAVGTVATTAVLATGPRGPQMRQWLSQQLAQVQPIWSNLNSERGRSP